MYVVIVFSFYDNDGWGWLEGSRIEWAAHSHEVHEKVVTTKKFSLEDNEDKVREDDEIIQHK